MNIPAAPWQLSGEAIALMASPLVFRLLVNYQSSPVGPYHEHALVRLKRQGLYIAPHVFQMSVDSPDSMAGGRTLWGYPKTLEKLNWSRKGRHVEFVQEGQSFRFRIFGPQIPLVVPFYTLQNHEGNWVKVSGVLRGKCQGALRGRQLGLSVSDFSLVISPPVQV